jgi:glycosyltransferase involved in cell wall biosynthesis
MTNGILYLSYDGILEPLGQSQVLAYIKNLALERPIHLISFEKKSDWVNDSERKKIESEILESGIVWHPLTYHKWPSALATSWDIFCGFNLGLFLIVRYRLRIIHARSYVPSVIAIMIKRLTGIKYLFDMRGFWADERIDGGIWSSDDNIYVVAKWFERRFLTSADHVVSLTHAAVRIIKELDYLHDRMPPFTVIPTCADLNRFTPILEKKFSGGFVLGYVGTVGTWYLFDETVACFSQLLTIRPNSKIIIVNRGEHSFIRARLTAAGLQNASIELITANHEEVPNLMAQMDAAVFFIRPVFSKQASAPTKLAEFLGCGIPCLVNEGVGDMSDLIEKEGVGVTLKSFDQNTLRSGLEVLLQMAADPTTKRRCVSAALKHFSLEEGIARYSCIYQTLENS